MPSIEENIRNWGHDHTWPSGGDEWSDGWGGSEKQWSGAILPRIKEFLPTGTILEIAPGYGRWTQFLKDQCNHLTGVDLNSNCIEECRKRFALDKNLEFVLNDGKSLDRIPDNSVDFIFSFDSLVHAEIDVIESYITQFPRILKSNGAAFIHHSNYAVYRGGDFVQMLSKVRGIRRLLNRIKPFGFRANPAWRANTVSASNFRRICESQGFTCRQELVNWFTDYLNDCFSTIVRSNSQAVIAAPAVTENYGFSEEAARIKGQPSGLPG